MNVFQVSGDGSLNNIANIVDNATLQLDGAGSMTTTQIGTTTYLFVASDEDNGVSVFRVANDGNLVNVYNITDNATLQLDQASSLTTAQIGTTTYLFVGGRTDNGV